MKYACLIGVTSVMILGLASCYFTKQPPSNFSKIVVHEFSVKRYMGQWYEVGRYEPSRFDFKYHKNLKNVTAHYRLRENGTIEVINKGTDLTSGEMKQSEAQGKFNGPTDRGALKVSFFIPFYSEYNVVKLDRNYKYALVFGGDNNSVWLLSREKTMPEPIKLDYAIYAQQHGYDLNRMVWTVQN